MKNWYSVNLLFEAEVEGEDAAERLCEESVRLVEAVDDDDALKKAVQVGGEAQHEYLNSEGRKVLWRFIRVLEVQDLCETQIGHGVEVYSKMYRVSSSND